MAYEFKKLGDVEVVETPIDTANVLIEEDGVIKKVAKDEVGGVKVASAAEVGQTIVVKAVDENGKPIEWECTNFPEGVTSWNDLTDKPFYEEINETIIFPEEELTYNADYQGIIIFKPFTLVVGEEYIVNWDGKEYILTAEQFGPSVMLGSMEVRNGDVTIPFAVMCGGFSEFSGQVITLPGVTHAVMSIKQRETVVHTIDHKYIKDMYRAEEGNLYVFKDADVSTMRQGDNKTRGDVDLPERMMIGHNVTYYLEFAGRVYTALSEGSAVFFEEIYTPDHPEDNPITVMCYSEMKKFRISDPDLSLERNWEGLTMSLYSKGEIITPIPAKYMPQPIVFEVDSITGNLTCSHTYDEVLDIVKRGSPVFYMRDSMMSPDAFSMRFIGFGYGLGLGDNPMPDIYIYEDMTGNNCVVYYGNKTIARENYE